MSRTIIVGFDGSESARAALRAAIRRMGEGDRLVVAHAPAIASALLEHPYYYEHAVERAREHGVDVLAETRFGPLTIPGRLTAGWGHGTADWSHFFRAVVTAADLLD